MLKKFNWDPEKIPKILKLNNNSAESSVSPELIKAQKNILMKAALAFLTIVLTIVILFAMTSAWYTNIVHTSGLVFEVESWGFSGEITVDDRPIQAGPGDSGIIGLSMDGTAGEILDVSIGVSKEAMLNSIGISGQESTADTDAMKKRFFFYVDKPGIKNGEQVDRFYINSTEDYTYTVFSEGSIRISEDFSNVPELKWQWVYDVLGYYVRANDDGNGTFIVQEYLRPIEYDFDSATFTEVATVVEADGEEITIPKKVIETIEGVPTEVFLEKFSVRDGYEGAINLTDNSKTITEKIEASNGTYYKVAEGIYAYLCDYQEIESATEFDTVLGRLAGSKNEENIGALRFPATVNISVQNREEQETVEVGTLSADVISGYSGKVIKLANDVALTESLVIPENANVEIDLNGKTISFPGISSKECAIEVPEGSSLLMLNGKVENENSAKKTGRGILASGAEVTLSGVEINGFDYGLRVTDNAATNKTDSVIRLYNCKTDAGTCGIYILGNGEASEQKTQLIIEKSELKAEGFVICGGGNPDSRGTDIRIINSILEGTGMDGWSVGIYQPQKDGETVIYKSTITARTGIALKAGVVEIIDSQIYGTGPYGDPGYAVSGSKDTGDAVYIEANYGHPISLIIKGESELKANDSQSMALRVYEEDAPNVTVEIISGTFGSEVSENWVAEGSELSSDKKRVSISLSAQE